MPKDSKGREKAGAGDDPLDRRALGREGAAHLEGDARQRRGAVRRGRACSSHGVRLAQAHLREAGRPLGAQGREGRLRPALRAVHRADARAGKGETFGGIDYYGHTKKEFEQRAKSLGITGYSRMRKAELVKKIEARERSQEARERRGRKAA